MSEPSILRDLSGGLVLRQARPSDTDALVQFNSMIHSDEGPDKPDLRVGAWTRDLMSGSHPNFQPGDFLIVEETASGRIVSSMNLISQTWSYDGIQFGVGRPELVGTLPEFRRRGLVRAQFEVVHEWSRQRGELLQAITGIPNYYRQFGYEMCVDLGGGRLGFEPHLPVLPEGQAEEFLVRPAGLDDVPFLQELYRAGQPRSLLSAEWTADLWAHELNGKSEQNVNRLALKVIERADGTRVGGLGHPGTLWGSILAALWYELAPGVPWTQVTPAVARCLWKTGDEYAARDGGTHSSFGFWMGETHPVYAAFGERLPRQRKPYAFFIRIPDLPAFLNRIAPVLEARLAGSAAAGFSGALKISFYTGGVCLRFEAGRLVEATPWQEGLDDKPAAAFPGLTFLHVLLGYRSLDEIMHIFPDCWTSGDTARPLLEALFPRKPSHVLEIS